MIVLVVSDAATPQQEKAITETMIGRFNATRIMRNAWAFGSPSENCGTAMLALRALDADVLAVDITNSLISSSVTFDMDALIKQAK